MLPHREPRYFRDLGVKLVALGFAWAGLSYGALLLGWLNIMAISVAGPLVGTGAAMALVPGQTTARSHAPLQQAQGAFEDHWKQVGGQKLVWLFGLSVGLLAGLAVFMLYLDSRNGM